MSEWLSGSLDPGQNIIIAMSWTPKSSRTHVVEIFVWESITEQNPLVKKVALDIFIRC